MMPKGHNPGSVLWIRTRNLYEYHVCATVSKLSDLFCESYPHRGKKRDHWHVSSYIAAQISDARVKYVFLNIVVSTA